jgi:hypothetical protein
MLFWKAFIFRIGRESGLRIGNQIERLLLRCNAYSKKPSISLLAACGKVSMDMYNMEEELERLTYPTAGHQVTVSRKFPTRAGCCLLTAAPCWTSR